MGYTSQIIPFSQPAETVGQRITVDYANRLKTKFKSTYLNFPSGVRINSQLVRETLDFGDQVKGIKFVFGLTNPKDPFSLLLLMVPSTNAEALSPAFNDLPSEVGHYDQFGQLHSAHSVANLSKNFGTWQLSIDPTLSEADAHRSCSFGRQVFEEILSLEGCCKIDFSFGKNEYVQLIMEPLNIHNENLWDWIFDYSNPSPPY